MTSKRIKRAQKWRARRYERAVNSALQTHGYTFKVRFHRLRNFHRREIELVIARVPGKFLLPKDSEKWERFARLVNSYLAEVGGGLPIADGVCECIKCGHDVMMLADPDEWQRRRDGRWKVTGYWPATGVCCDHLYADDFERTRVFDPRECHRRRPGPVRRIYAEPNNP